MKRLPVKHPSHEAFSYQLPGYSAQSAYGMSSWARQSQRYSQGDVAIPMQSSNYPNATGSGSLMNYGGYYPPTSSHLLSIPFWLWQYTLT